MHLGKYIAILLVLLVSLHIAPDIFNSNGHKNIEVDCSISELVTNLIKISPTKSTLVHNNKIHFDEEGIGTEKQLENFDAMSKKPFSTVFSIDEFDMPEVAE